MNKRYLTSLMTAGAVAASLILLVASGSAQDTLKGGNKGGKGGGKEKAEDKLTPKGPTPRMPDGKPDFTGVITPANFANLGQVPLQPWAEEVYKQRRATLSKDDPEGFCLPAGVPRISPFPQKYIQRPEVLVILDEGNVHSYRQIFINGEHPKNPDPLWMGHSIGKWEGDTLVVDSVGFNDQTWLNGGGYPHTDALHVIERLTRTDLGHMEIDITIEDSKAFTKPHTFHRTYLYRPTWEIEEYVCNEFNVDKDHLVGK